MDPNMFPPLRLAPRPGRVFHRIEAVAPPPVPEQGAPVAKTTEPKKKVKAKKKKAAKVPAPVTSSASVTLDDEFPEFRMLNPVTHTVPTGVSYSSNTSPLTAWSSSDPAWTTPVETPVEEPITGKLVYYKDDAGQHRWRLKAKNGRVLCAPEGFSSLTKAKNNLRAVTFALTNPTIEYDEESYPS